MNEDMSNLMNQINNMMKNNEIPDDIKNMINSITNNSGNNSENSNQNNSDNDTNSSSENRDSADISSNSSTADGGSMPEFDMGTILKMKRIMDSMKSNQNDPRATLLKSLKPYLKESRKEKVDQYIQIFGMGKVFEMLNPLGGDPHK